MTATMTPATIDTIKTTAAAGLGKTARVGIYNCGDRSSATATDSEVWVEVCGDCIPCGSDPAGTIPDAPAASGITASVMISGRDLRRVIEGIVPATDTDTARFALGGTLVEIAEGSLLTVVGTDGRRMHIGYVQPSSITGEASPIVHADQWRALDASIRAACRRLLGANGRRIDAVYDAGTVCLTVGSHKATGGEVVTIEWQSAEVIVRATAVAVMGRFPRWRDCLPENAPASYRKPITTSTIDATAVAAAVADHATQWRAAEKAARAAWKVEREEKKRARRYHGGDFAFSPAVDCSPAGVAGVAVAGWSAAVPVTPVTVKLDHRYLADAMAAAAAWGSTAVESAGSDEYSAVTFTAGGDCGPRVVVVVMPMAAD